MTILRLVGAATALLLCIQASSVHNDRSQQQSTLQRVSGSQVFEHKAEISRPNLLCEICQAVVKEVEKKAPKLPKGIERVADLSRKEKLNREQRIFSAIDGVCKTETFSRYEFSPPNMIKACGDFRSDHDGDLEDMFYAGTPEREIRTEICIKKSKRCKQLWTHEAEEQKRDRTPAEQKKEQEDARKAGREHEKKEKARKKKEKAERRAKRLAEKAANATRDAAAAEKAATETPINTEPVASGTKEAVKLQAEAAKHSEL